MCSSDTSYYEPARMMFNHDSHRLFWRKHNTPSPFVYTLLMLWCDGGGAIGDISRHQVRPEVLSDPPSYLLRLIRPVPANYPAPLF